MSKSIVISERDNIAAVSENGRVLEFFIHRGDILLGDVYLAKVENILPSIDAAFVNVGSDKMGFLHASDVTGKGALKERLKPGQQIMVQVVKEPTGHKGPRVTMSVSIPGRFLVIMPKEKGINVSKKIDSSKERARLKSVVSLLKPTGVGVIIRTEAEGQSEAEIQEDLEYLLEKWNTVVTASDTITPPNLLHRDQDLLYKVIREACSEAVDEIILDTSFGYHRATQLLQSWNISHKLKLSVHKGTDSILTAKGIDREIRNALQTKVNLPSGGYLYIQTTEALSVIDVNSGKFTGAATQDETIRRTNLESVDEIARQLRLRNIGGMIIVDFIDMEIRVDKLAVLEAFELALEKDKGKPQIGQLSDLGLVEMTRHRQGQSLSEIFTKKCHSCNGNGQIIEDFNFSPPPQDGETVVKTSKLRFSKSAGKNAIVVNESGKQTQNTIKNKIMHSGTKRIRTAPSLVASVDIKQEKQDTSEHFILNNEIIQEYFSDSSYTPNVSKSVRYYAVPSGVARNYFGKNYMPDVFTILQELESAEYTDPSKEKPAGQQPQNQYRRPVNNQKPQSFATGNIDRNKQVQPIKQQPIKPQPIKPQPIVVQPVEPPVQQLDEKTPDNDKDNSPEKTPYPRQRRPQRRTIKPDTKKDSTRIVNKNEPENEPKNEPKNEPENEPEKQ